MASDGDPLTYTGVGGTVEIRKQHEQHVGRGFSVAVVGEDREAENYRFENVRIETSEGEQKLVWEQVCELTRTMPRRDYQQMQAKQEYERHKSKQARTRRQRITGAIGILLGGAVGLGMYYSISQELADRLVINGEAVTFDPGSVLPVGGVVVLLLIMFLYWALPYLPRRVKP